MGARPYSPVLGGFLQPDGVLGGNANGYGYSPDPINGQDYSGNAYVYGENWFVDLILVLGWLESLPHGILDGLSGTQIANIYLDDVVPVYEKASTRVEDYVAAHEYWGDSFKPQIAALAAQNCPLSGCPDIATPADILNAAIGGACSTSRALGYGWIVRAGYYSYKGVTQGSDGDGKKAAKELLGGLASGSAGSVAVETGRVTSDETLVIAGVARFVDLGCTLGGR
jgi:hypothetical protein